MTEKKGAESKEESRHVKVSFEGELVEKTGNTSMKGARRALLAEEVGESSRGIKKRLS